MIGEIRERFKVTHRIRFFRDAVTRRDTTGSVNRAQVTDGGEILGFLLPVFVELLLDNPTEGRGAPTTPWSLMAVQQHKGGSNRPTSVFPARLPRIGNPGSPERGGRQRTQPRDLTLVEALRIDADFRGNKRDANYRALRRLDELREFAQLLPLLPVRPIGFSAARRVPLLTTLSPAWDTQVISWIEAITKTNWDPVDQEFADDHAKHAHVMRSAFRTILRIGLDIGKIGPAETDLKVILTDDEILCAIAGDMFGRRTRSKRDGRLVPRTSRKYLKALNQVRAYLRIDTHLLKLVLANNAVVRVGKKDDRCMTPKNRKF